MEELGLYYRLGLATAIGLLIGAERGWHTRDQSGGRRIAGIRTFALIGLLGGVSGLLAGKLGVIVVAVAFLGVGALVALSYRADLQAATPDRGMTTEIALLATFALAAYIVLGDPGLGAAGAVVLVTLLQIKPQLHHFVQTITRLELDGAIRLLVISVVLLPLLPDEGVGPGNALNPFELWLMVVLISALSFAGYIAVKLLGARLGTLMTGVFGGLVSSTALAVSFSRFARREPALAPVLAGGLGLAMAVMLVRVVMIAWVLNRDVALGLAIPFGAGALALLVTALLLTRRAETQRSAAPSTDVSDPCDLVMALKFGVLLLAITLATHFVRQRFGAESLYGVALIAGLVDVDAITLTFARAAEDATAIRIAVIGIALAVVSNSVVKLGIAAVLGGGGLTGKVGILLGAGLAAGAAGLFAFWP